MLPCTLYIHIPWCIRKCPYCDFNSHKSPDHLPEITYIDAIIADLDEDLHRFSTRSIHAIFIGGGTPSLLSAQAYDRLFTALQTRLSLSSSIEITMEANPGTVEQSRFKDFRNLGINRLSLGIQSFNPTHLDALGRIHDGQQAMQAIETARAAGFDNLNLDLMHSLPNQTIDEGLADIQCAISFQPEHLSWYQLTIEPNTFFYKHTPILPSEDNSATLEEEGLSILKDAGYDRYEISAFCRDNKMAQHNLNYWEFGDYFGIGAGAHGKLTANDWTIHRTRKSKQPTEYLRTQPNVLADLQTLDEKNRIFEFMLNTTRLEKPIPNDLFTQRTGLSFTYLEKLLNLAVHKGLISRSPTHWEVTILGRRYTNNLQELFLPENA